MKNGSTGSDVVGGSKSYWCCGDPG